MAIIPEQFMNAVVAIGIDQFDADGKRKSLDKSAVYWI